MRQFGGLFGLAVLGSLSLPSCHSRSVQLEVEKNSPAVIAGKLAEDIGIETLGGTFTPLLERGQPVPCEVTKTFSTATDNQEQFQIRMFRGTAATVAETSLLGLFVVAGLPKRPRGTISVGVTLSVTASGVITISASEATGYPIVLRRDDR